MSGVLLSKVFDRQQAGIEQYREENRRLAELQVRQQMVGRGFFAVVQTFFSVTPARGLPRRRAPDLGRLDVRSAPARSSRSRRSRRGSSFRSGSLLQVSTEIQSSLALFERVFQYLDLEHDIVDAPDAVAAAA